MATFSWLRLILGTTTTVCRPFHLKRPETRCRLWFVSLCGDCVYGTMFTAPSHNPFRTNSGEHHKPPLTLPCQHHQHPSRLVRNMDRNEVCVLERGTAYYLTQLATMFLSTAREYFSIAEPASFLFHLITRKKNGQSIESAPPK